MRGILSRTWLSFFSIEPLWKNHALNNDFLISNIFWMHAGLMPCMDLKTSGIIHLSRECRMVVGTLFGLKLGIFRVIIIIKFLQCTFLDFFSLLLFCLPQKYPWYSAKNIVCLLHLVTTGKIPTQNTYTYTHLGTYIYKDGLWYLFEIPMVGHVC